VAISLTLLAVTIFFVVFNFSVPQGDLDSFFYWALE